MILRNFISLWSFAVYIENSLWGFENMAATKCTCLSQERLTELIKSIFKEEFEIQQKNIVTLISGNFEITMQEIKKVNNEID